MYLYTQQYAMNKFLKTFYKKLKRLRKDKNSNGNMFIVCIAVVMVWR